MWVLRILGIVVLLVFAYYVWQTRDNPPTGNGLPQKEETQPLSR